MADINFEGNNIHNPKGYVSIGGEAEIFFNTVRAFAFNFLKDFGELFFGKEFIAFENMRIVLKNKFKTPPPYNGMFDPKGMAEVTHENERHLNFYDTQEKLKDQMDYMYENILSKADYHAFWMQYRKRYFDLKKRYKEAYEIQDIW